MLPDRRSFLFGITLSEIAFILFFVLLLFAFLKFLEKDKHIDELTQRTDHQRQALEHIRDRMAAHDAGTLDELFGELAALDTLEGEIQTLRDENTELQTRLVELNQVASLVEAAASESSLDEPITELVQETLAARGEIEALRERDPDLVPEGTSMPEAIRELSRRYGDQEGREKHLLKQLDARTGGRDFPPCWAERDTGDIEYLFDIAINDEGLRLTSAAPQSRQHDYRLLPGTAELTARRLDIDEFAVLARPVFRSSVRDNCRHFVRIHDYSTNGRNYKWTLTIEDYFYKFVATRND